MKTTAEWKWKKTANGSVTRWMMIQGMKPKNSASKRFAFTCFEKKIN
jgi:ribosomal protein L35